MSRLRINEHPRHCYHKASDRGYVTLSGRVHYTGPKGSYGTVEARREYDRFVGEWLANGKRPILAAGPKLTVGDMLSGWAAWARGHYRKAGQVTTRVKHVELVAADAKGLYASLPAAEFGPLKFKAVRQVWVGRGLARSTVNEYASLLRGAFAWAVENELIDSPVLWALKAVRGLQAGRSPAHDNPPVGTVDDATLERTLAVVPRPITAMLRLMRLAGMRPCEAIGMRVTDLRRPEGDGPWTYTVQDRFNKLAHKGQPRTVYLGPRAVAVLSPWVARVRAREWPEDGPIFRSPISRDYYHHDWPRQAVHRACRRLGIPQWSPNQLRHSRATEIRAARGLEGSQVILGHTNLETTQVYAESDSRLAVEIAMESG